MLRSFFTIALRSLARYRVYATINIFGLAVGIAFFTLLVVLIRHELSYDSQHQQADHTYRVIEFMEKNGIGEKSASMPFPFASNV